MYNDVDPHSRYYYAMMDAAKARANELRDEALDTFWQETGRQALRSLRAANRFAHSLLRHARLRRAGGVAVAATSAGVLAATQQRSASCG